MREGDKDAKTIARYFEPIARWTDALQNDFAARADWCVQPFDRANHPPVVRLAHALDLKVRAGSRVSLSARGTTDPDGDALTYRWWRYRQADSHEGSIEIVESGKREASLVVPADAAAGKTIHVVCEVTDAGTPRLTRYRRVVVEVR